MIDKIYDSNSGIMKELATLRVIGSSLFNWFDTLKATYSGRYPNEVRAALQAVTMAITSKAPPGMLSSIARLTRANRFQMALLSNKWDSWLEDSSTPMIELRGQVRSDKLPEAWVKHCTEVWVQNTRPSVLCMKPEKPGSTTTFVEDDEHDQPVIPIFVKDI
jgi:hypothetical protein